MNKCLDGTLEGTGQYIADLQKEYKKNPEKGEILFSLTIFDTVFEPWLIDQPIQDVDLKILQKYQPRGNTALYDAIGLTTMEVEQRLAESDPDGAVLVVVMSDGDENSSRQFNRWSINSFIKEREARGNWTYVYLGANVDAPAVAAAMGMSPGNAAYYSQSKGSNKRVASAMHTTTSSLRSRGGQSVSDSFAVAGMSTDFRDPSDATPTGDPIDLSKLQSKTDISKLRGK